MFWPTCTPTSCSLSAPCRAFLREYFGWSKADYWFPEVRSLGGAVAMFVFVLYPYVYLLTRTAFIERASGMLEASRTLGLGPWRGFFRVSLPLARPAVAAGAALALMETLADYGTVSYFGVQTFTTGIYRAWFSLGDRIAAAQLAAALLGFVMLLLADRAALARPLRAFTTPPTQPATHWPALVGLARLAGQRGVRAAADHRLPAAGVPSAAPGAGRRRGAVRRTFLGLARNSFLLAGLTAIIAVSLAVLLAYGARLSKGCWRRPSIAWSASATPCPGR
jgi:iron(III) transport system permease protein